MNKICVAARIIRPSRSSGVSKMLSKSRAQISPSTIREIHEDPFQDVKFIELVLRRRFTNPIVTVEIKYILKKDAGFAYANWCREWHQISAPRRDSLNPRGKLVRSFSKGRAPGWA